MGRRVVLVGALVAVVLLSGALSAFGESSSFDITIASFNVHGIFIPDSKCPLATRKFRFSRIADVLNRYDVVVLQEFFGTRRSPDRYRRFLLEPSNHGYQRRHPTGSSGPLYDSGLGVLVGGRLAGSASNWDVIEYEDLDHQYKRCHGKLASGSDCLSTKGYGRLEIEVLGGPLVLYTTHLDASDGREDRTVRVGQMKQLDAAIEHDRGVAVVLAGDFNTETDAKTVDSLALDALRKTQDLSQVQPADSSDPELGESCGSWRRCHESVIDHVFFRSSSALTVEVLEAVWLKPRGGRFCSRLSDHPVLVTTFRMTAGSSNAASSRR